MTTWRSIEKSSILLFISSVLICFVAAELAVRRFIFSAHAWSYTDMSSVRNFGISGLVQASPYQDILWELKPNLDTTNKFHSFRTNSEGLRDRSYAKQKPAGVVRVAVVGDSFTMPEGVEAEDAFHSVMEERLNRESGGAKYEFINFGVAGYSLPQYIATIKHKVIQYQPDLVLIAFCAANDSKKPNLEAFKEPYKVKPVGNGFYESHFFDLLGDIYKHYYNEIRGRYAGSNADREYVEAEFKELAELHSANHLETVIAYIDNKAASADYPMVSQMAARYGFAFVDGTRNFGAEISPEHILYKTDKHPNAEAHRIIAETLLIELGPRLQQLASSRTDLARRGE